MEKSGKFVIFGQGEPGKMRECQENDENYLQKLGFWAFLPGQKFLEPFLETLTQCMCYFLILTMNLLP